MTDQVTDHALELTSPPKPTGDARGQAQKNGSPASNARPDDRSPPVRSDIGTILLHWTLVVAIVTSLLTGLRLSSDAEGAWFSKLFEPILPQGEIWTWHYLSAVFVLALIFAYAAYMSLARLKRRISSKKMVVLTLPASTKLRLSAVNVIAYWILFGAVLTLTATGVWLYLGHGGIWVTVHYTAALVVLTYIVAHVVLHYAYGGLQQLLRLFRPQKLRRFPGMAAHPLAIALMIGAVVLAGAITLNYSTLDELVVAKADVLPELDGVLDDAAWQNAEPVFVETQQGSNLKGTGASTVEMRAVQVGDKIVFAFRWEDATRSLKRHPLVKREDGWHMLNNRADLSDETAFYEDKFSVAFSTTDAFGGGASTHMGPKPISDKPKAFHGRGFHYTTDGSLVDVWQWKASRGGMLGRVDDMHFSTPVEPSEAHVAGKARYSAGYNADKGTSFYVYNYHKKDGSDYLSSVDAIRLPKDYKATAAKMGTIDLSVEAIEDEGSQWWMFEDESVPYSSAKDAEIPVGTVIPGVLIQGEYSGSRADLLGGSKWQDGYWTLEVVRDMDTGHDQDLAMTDGLFIWLSVFDHNQTRHTRHSRPVRLTFN
ncbi:ethylbenzene dehydrogenase-related protein [Roseibium sediminicola]|uniref:Ethylbenzene dehydrogenase-related protein n=1 Tax=Roseibium sediminicola TaxID=2933272 RepID=A0ABT0GWT4_9HYPH|nr:ethylbenzene dehydrogenase-related protein [Roseibium sp. CAU 1639]MCK7613904.1 ethylbenzene dehydrogenase-related protein [Roseibium sp. CAU 1639]